MESGVGFRIRFAGLGRDAAVSHKRNVILCDSCFELRVWGQTYIGVLAPEMATCNPELYLAYIFLTAGRTTQTPQRIQKMEPLKGVYRGLYSGI